MIDKAKLLYQSTMLLLGFTAQSNRLKLTSLTFGYVYTKTHLKIKLGIKKPLFYFRDPINLLSILIHFDIK